MRHVPKGNLDPPCHPVYSASPLVMKDEEEVRRAQYEKQISAAETRHFQAKRGGIVHYRKATPARAAQRKNPTLPSQEEIDGRALSWPDCFVIARSRGTWGRKCLKQEALKNGAEKISARQTCIDSL